MKRIYKILVIIIIFVGLIPAIPFIFGITLALQSILSNKNKAKKFIKFVSDEFKDL